MSGSGLERAWTGEAEICGHSSDFQALWSREFHRMKGVEERWRQERDSLPSANHPPPSWLLLESLPTAMVPGPALCVILGVLGLRVAGDCRA